MSKLNRITRLALITLVLCSLGWSVKSVNAEIQIIPAMVPSNTTSRVSIASDGTQGSAESSEPSISADGRFVAFSSTAWNLVSGDSNGSASDIFIHDIQTGNTSLISVASDGTQGSTSSYMPSISSDGRYVAFLSWASNLVSDDTNGVPDIFYHDTVTGETTRVSVSSNGAEANDQAHNLSMWGALWNLHLTQAIWLVGIPMESVIFFFMIPLPEILCEFLWQAMELKEMIGQLLVLSLLMVIM